MNKFYTFYRDLLNPPRRTRGIFYFKNLLTTIDVQRVMIYTSSVFLSVVQETEVREPDENI